MSISFKQCQKSDIILLDVQLLHGDEPLKLQGCSPQLSIEKDCHRMRKNFATHSAIPGGP